MLQDVRLWKIVEAIVAAGAALIVVAAVAVVAVVGEVHGRVVATAALLIQYFGEFLEKSLGQIRHSSARVLRQSFHHKQQVRTLN